MKIDSKNLVNSVVENNIITEKELKLIIKRMNSGEKIDLQEIWDNPVKLTQDQENKGILYLRNLYQTPKGAERKNNPFGYREIAILNNFTGFELAGTYDAGNYNNSYHVPLYNVCSPDNCFQYYMAGGTIHIVG